MTDSTSPAPLRVLFCYGISPAFFALPRAAQPPVFAAFGTMFKAIQEMSGVKVIGTLDDDQLMVGPSTTWPWTSYILADVADLATVSAVCNLLRITPVGDDLLWKYARVEARVGRAVHM